MEKFYAKNRKTWRDWLEKNSGEKTEVKLIYYKKGTGKKSINYEIRLKKLCALAGLMACAIV